MAILFDLSSFMDYYRHMKAQGKAKISISKALDNLNIKQAVGKVGKLLKKGEEVYVVPSVTGETGVVEIGDKKFYEYGVPD